MAQKDNIYAVILAGGSGTRFWPLSRSSSPKQFLDIVGKQTLFQQTLARIKPLVKPQNVYIVTNKKFKTLIQKQARGFKLPSANIMLEPSGKNTAPAICWAAARIYQSNPNAIMTVLPSDHLIAKKGNFLNCLKRAIKLAQKDYLVTLGIKPTRPETGYGYLKTTKRSGVTIVSRFTEKPSLAKAKRFIAQRNYYWNSGMFIWKCSTILNEFTKQLPKVNNLLGPHLNERQRRHNWTKLPSISIDYGILEKAKRVAAVPAANIGWSDLGSWEALSEILTKDKKGNYFKGDVLGLNCKNTVVCSDKKVIAAVGLDNITIVDTPDALLVCPTDQSQAVRDVVDILKRKKRKEI